MKDAWLQRWEERYSKEEYAYGTQPNNYLKEQLPKLKPETILFPAEGEGRNAVFAARLGWEVSAFDISVEGKNKALRLAENYNVSIDYQVGELPNLSFHNGQFGTIALIYAHFPPETRPQYHKLLGNYLRKGGMIIFEAFSKNHLAYRQQNEKVGGPKDLNSLFSVDEIRADFENYEILELVEVEVELNEGLYHNGTGSVIRFVGQKK